MWKSKIAAANAWHTMFAERYPNASEGCNAIAKECFEDLLHLLGPGRCELNMHTFKDAGPVREGKPNFPEDFLRETLMVQLYNYNDPKNLMPPLCFELKIKEGGDLRGPVAALLNKDRLQDGRKLLEMVHKHVIHPVV